MKRLQGRGAAIVALMLPVAACGSLTPAQTVAVSDTAQTVLVTGAACAADASHATIALTTAACSACERDVRPSVRNCARRNGARRRRSAVAKSDRISLCAPR